MSRRQRDRLPVHSRRAPPRRLCSVLVVASLAAAAAVGTAGTVSAAEADPDTLTNARALNDLIVQGAQDARKNGGSCVQGLAAELLSYHEEQLAGQLENVARMGGEPPPPSQLSDGQRQELAAVRAKARTAGYDAAWLAAQEKWHKEAVDLSNKLAASNSKDVKAAGAAALPKLQSHLQALSSGACSTTTSTGDQKPTSVPSGDGGQVADAWRLRRFGGLGLVGIGLLVLAGHAVTVLRRRTRTPGG